MSVYRDPIPDDDLRTRFHDGNLSPEEWTHRAHVRIGFLHVPGEPFETALSRVRDGIRQLNRRHGVPDALDRGYHETMTQAFLRLIAAAAAAAVVTDSSEFCEQHPHLMRKQILLDYYSRDRILSAEAKQTFIAPDLQPLPVPSTRPE